MFAPGLPPYDVEFESIPYSDLPKYEGALQPNKDLELIEYISTKVDATSLGYLKLCKINTSYLSDAILIHISYFI